MTLAHIRARYEWLLPLLGAVFVVLALGAMVNTLPWDRPLSSAIIDTRTGWMEQIVRRVSFLGSNVVVFAVSGILALAAARRCPRLAMLIVAVALARPGLEWMLKEFVGRARPDQAQMVNGTGYSFPSGHPMATAVSWGMLPLVAALYTRKRVVWWSIAIGAWALIVAVAFSRVWLGVHWPTDVFASIVLALIGLTYAEHWLNTAHGANRNVDDVEGGEDASAAPSWMCCEHRARQAELRRAARRPVASR
jgi:membrane-associated phospholipid phosphatase